MMLGTSNGRNYALNYPGLFAQKSGPQLQNKREPDHSSAYRLAFIHSKEPHVQASRELRTNLGFRVLQIVSTHVIWPGAKFKWHDRGRLHVVD